MGLKNKWVKVHANKRKPYRQVPSKSADDLVGYKDAEYAKFSDRKFLSVFAKHHVNVKYTSLKKMVSNIIHKPNWIVTGFGLGFIALAFWLLKLWIENKYYN